MITSDVHEPAVLFQYNPTQYNGLTSILLRAVERANTICSGAGCAIFFVPVCVVPHVAHAHGMIGATIELEQSMIRVSIELMQRSCDRS